MKNHSRERGVILKMQGAGMRLRVIFQGKRAQFFRLFCKYF